MSERRICSLVAVGVVLAACGGSAAPSANSPDREGAPKSVAAESDGVRVIETASGGATQKTESSLGRARTELDRAERELGRATGDCAAACRALASMERATGHLCELASEADGSCEEARSKVRRARDRVRSTCGSCPGGPTLERNAPIPSP